MSQSLLSLGPSDISLQSQTIDSDNFPGDYSLSSIQSNQSLTSSMTLVFAPKCYCLSVAVCGHDRLDEITDICTSLRALSHAPDPLAKPQTLGVLRASGASFELKAPKAVGEGDSKIVLSLDDLFTGDQDKLARRHRISLALRLAWGVTQLHQTPWLSPSWTWSDFSAMGDRQRGQIDEGLFITKSFPSTRHPSFSSAAQNSDTPKGAEPPSLLSIAIGEPVIARLGYALIELASGKRLASLHQPDQSISQEKELQDLWTARQLLDSGFITDEEGDVYSDVVNACLYQQVQKEGGLGLKKLRSQDAGFERDLTKAIVQPLYNIYRREWESASLAVPVF